MSTLLTMGNRLKADLRINGTEMDAQIYDAIRSAIRQKRGLKFWFLRALGNVNVAQNSNIATLPSDFSVMGDDNVAKKSTAVQFLQSGQYRNIYQMPLAELQSKFLQNATVNQGVPTYCAIEGNQIYFDRASQDATSLRIIYYKQDAMLPTGNGDTSVWFDDGWDVVRSLAMVIFKRDADGYGEAEESGSMADYHYKQLCQRAQSIEMGAL